MKTQRNGTSKLRIGKVKNIKDEYKSKIPTSWGEGGGGQRASFWGRKSVMHAPSGHNFPES